MANDKDKLKPWKTTDSKVVTENPWFKIRRDHMIASTGAELDYYIHDGHDSVLSVCINSKNEVLIERQYRPPVAKVSVDYPAGRVEESDASTEDAIKRELAEETGFSVDSIERLAVLDKDPGFSSAKIHIYLVRAGERGDTSPDESENIVCQFVTPEEVLKLIASREMSCAFCVAATHLAFGRLGWEKTTPPRS